MYNSKNILLISDETDFSEKLREKLVLLRDKDSLCVISYEEAEKQVKTIDSRIILVHEHKLQNKTLN